MTSARQGGAWAIAATGFALFAFFFLSGSLTTPLTPFGANSSRKVQAIGAFVGFIPFCAILFRNRGVGRVLGRYWVMLLPVGLATLSIAWSVAPELAFRRIASLGLTTAFGFWLALRFSPRDLLALVAWGGVMVIVLNLLPILFNPAHGLHPNIDPETRLPDQHVGKWRGLFGHKNDFGRSIALCASLCVAGALARIGGRAGQCVLIAAWSLGVVMTLKAASSQALSLITVVPVTLLLVWMMRKMTPQTRAFTLFIMVPGLILATMAAQLIFVTTLELLGRDASLTGRTDIWQGTLLALRGSELLGGGYGSGWELIGPRIASLTGISIGHAHNGYLDLAADLGWTGVTLTLIAFVSLGALSFRSIMGGVRLEAGVLGLTLVIFTLIGNWAGSFFLLHNSLYWALPLAAYVHLADLAYLRDPPPSAAPSRNGRIPT